MTKYLKAVFTAAVVSLAACSDSGFEPVASDVRPLMNLANTPMAFMENYVAMGTSLSMGWASDGVYSASQATSWPVQLADRFHTSFTYPAIAAPGCKPPYAAPLSSFGRIDGTSLVPPTPPSTFCAPNEPGVQLPTNNLAVENATAREGLTGAEAALTGRGPVTSRVLPSGKSQVTTMLSLNPSLVSVEFGGNELLPAQAGILIPNITFTPFETFRASYAGIISAVRSTGAKALLVSIRTDLRNFPAIRTGPEIAAQRAAFARYNVSVNANCDDSPNFLFVRGIVPTAILTGAAMRPFGVAYNLSCDDVPLNPANPKADYILTPGDIGFINALAERMSDEIEQHAADNGYAVFPLGVLYNTSKEGVPFDLEAFLHSPTPYGELISLDGVHPSAKGQAVFARAAARAIRKTYVPAEQSVLTPE
jgi:lysophospholipase L1-like esterase